MRNREEVLREFGRKDCVDNTGRRVEWLAKPWVQITDAMADRIRELEAQLVSPPYTLASAEPVAWALCNSRGEAVLADTETDYLGKVRFHFDRDDAADAPHSLRPLVFGDVAHPSAAGVSVTDAMVDRAVEVYMNTTSALTPDEFREMQPDNYNMMWCGLRAVLTAALTRTSEGASA